MWQSLLFLNYTLIAFRRRQHKASAYSFIKPELGRHVVNIKPEPDPKSLARLTVWCSWRPKQGPHGETCERARKGHSHSLKGANEQKIFVDKLPFPNRLAQHTSKLLS